MQCPPNQNDSPRLPQILVISGAVVDNEALEQCVKRRCQQSQGTVEVDHTGRCGVDHVTRLELKVIGQGKRINGAGVEVEHLGPQRNDAAPLVRLWLHETAYDVN